MKYYKVDTAFGRCWIGYETSPLLIQRIRLPGRAGQQETSMQVTAHPSANVLALAEALKRYFSGGDIPAIPWDDLDMAQLTPNQQKLLRSVAEIPPGSVRSYGEVARLAGFPGGARFAGNTLAKNPFPVFIPCHRVIRSDGGIGGFGAGVEMKKKMLALERR
ncbi:MAG: MGMT family protein [Thermodesulfobacteriota bacterium]|nr:MGMT family protein [Thermodesulfobacteriota bacterium]